MCEKGILTLIVYIHVKRSNGMLVCTYVRKILLHQIYMYMHISGCDYQIK